jgi:hypothetical protein
LRELAEHEPQAVGNDVVALAGRPLEDEAVQVVVFRDLYGLLYLPQTSTTMMRSTSPEESTEESRYI